jgi:hypothetical protein
MDNQFWFGVVASSLAFLLKDLWVEKRRRREDLESVADDCALALHELRFCLTKLGPLRDTCLDASKQIQRGLVRVPSYRLNTETLGAACSQAAKSRFLGAELRVQLSECCFQAAHVARRLEENVAHVPSLDAKDTLGLDAASANWTGLSGLCAEVVDLFDATAPNVERAERQMRATLERHLLWSGKNLVTRVQSEEV